MAASWIATTVPQLTPVASINISVLRLTLTNCFSSAALLDCFGMISVPSDFKQQWQLGRIGPVQQVGNEDVEYGLRLRGVHASERREQSDKYLRSVGLIDFADRYPKDLSGGMKQRVAIARTLINKPKLVLMDEPFGALDPQTRWGMQSLLLDVSRTEDNTILFVTHDVSEAVYLADSIYVLAPRPTHILHRVDVPYFANRDMALKSAPEFRKVEQQLLDLLYRV